MLKYVLFPFELLYRLGFFLVTRYKKYCGNKKFNSFKIISVGNLTVGGTGKSVVVPKLVQILGADKCAIVLRGYKGTAEKTGNSVLVCDGKKIFVDVTTSGDEAMMYAMQQEGVPVVVGADRAKSCELLEEFKKTSGKNIEYVILDDAYQNFSVHKDWEILLLDARSPFDNGHCLPAGRLREKDWSRADFIFLTHADKVAAQEIEKIKKQLAPFDQKKIFCGKHGLDGLDEFVIESPQSYALKPILDKLLTFHPIIERKILLIAGIGSFRNVLDTAQLSRVKDAGIKVVMTEEFKDHYAYTQKDLDYIADIVDQKKLDAVLTTSKDFVKLISLLFMRSDDLINKFFVVRVEFEFLSEHEYDEFVEALHEGVTQKEK